MVQTFTTLCKMLSCFCVTQHSYIARKIFKIIQNSKQFSSVCYFLLLNGKYHFHLEIYNILLFIITKNLKGADYIVNGINFHLFVTLIRSLVSPSVLWFISRCLPKPHRILVGDWELTGYDCVAVTSGLVHQGVPG